MLTGMTLDEIKALGLDAQDIKIHQERITQGLQHRDQLFIPIEDTCRLDNGGIIPARYLQDLKNQKPEGFVAFIPAAGAASRYFKPLADFRAALA
ncbi:MAG: hypothetical protein NTX25_05180, partial [Proteobacteria bacterium]|nr:hypothetical protein [Pseudomonadota bacterium]